MVVIQARHKRQFRVDPVRRSHHGLHVCGRERGFDGGQLAHQMAHVHAAIPPFFLALCRQLLTGPPPTCCPRRPSADSSLGTGPPAACALSQLRHGDHDPSRIPPRLPLARRSTGGFFMTPARTLSFDPGVAYPAAHSRTAFPPGLGSKRGPLPSSLRSSPLAESAREPAATHTTCLKTLLTNPRCPNPLIGSGIQSP